MQVCILAVEYPLWTLEPAGHGTALLRRRFENQSLQELLFLLPWWEAAWLPRPTEGVTRRLIQAQIMFLKSADLLPLRGAVSAAVESRHGTTCCPQLA